jgi:sulfoxide reductase heme-binding subunit YedZ
VLAWKWARGALGANPVATALNQLGLLALVLLVACLACTPLRIVFGLNWPIRIRKTLGLAAFAAASCHFLVYVVVDQSLALGVLWADVIKRPFIAVGFIAFLLLIPLASTSTKKAVQRLGFARWKRLHRLVYVVGLLGVLHFYLRVKADTTEPWIHGIIIAGLLAVRLVDGARARRTERRSRSLA